MAWLAAFFLVAFYAIVAVGLGNITDLYEPVPHWNPLDWNVGYILQALEDVLPGGRTWDVFVRTLLYVGAGGRALAGDRLPGRLLRLAPRARAGRRSLLLVLLVAPFWISYLMRMFAWTNLLDTGGYAAQVLNALSIDSLFCALGLLDGDDWLGGQPIAVILGLVYGYVPYLILPLYASLDRIDQRLIEAARDLGALARAGLPARRAAAVEGRDAGRDRADRAADVRRLLHAGPDVRLARDGAARQHDQQLRAGRAGQGAGRRADAAAVARSCWSSCSITCATCGEEETGVRRPSRRASPGGDVDLRRVVAAAGAAGDPLRVQRGALADVLAGLLAALVLDRSDAERAQRPDAVGGAGALARARRAGDADRDAAGHRAGDRPAALARPRRRASRTC